jgi:hypothetical protein
MYPCSKCGYAAKTKQALEKHINRKTPCDDGAPSTSKKYPCKWCKTEFNHASNCYRHQGICKENKSVEEEDIDLSELIRLMKQNKMSVSELVKLVKEGKKIPRDDAQVVVNNNISITINNFGQESVSSDRFSKEFLDKCVRNASNGIQMLTKAIHFNDDYPSDKNIRRGTISNKTVKIMQEGKWVLADKNTVVDKVMWDKQQIIYMHFLNDMTEFEDIFDIVTRWYYQIREKRGELFFNIRNEIYTYILNNS